MPLLKLNLGSGGKRVEGWTNVDKLPLPNVDVQYDLERHPWPWKTCEVAEISAVHLVEHLSDLVHFMDECWRILRPGGTLFVETPDAADIDLAFCDPTHKHYYRKHTFINYFTRLGVEQFGYTQRPWAILQIESDGHVIRAHMMPLKQEG